MKEAIIIIWRINHHPHRPLGKCLSIGNQPINHLSFHFKNTFLVPKDHFFLFVVFSMAFHSIVKLLSSWFKIVTLNELKMCNGYSLIFRLIQIARLFFSIYRKIPLLVPGVGQFSNASSFELDQLVSEF